MSRFPGKESNSSPGPKPLAECRLCAFVDAGYLGNRSPAEAAEVLCRGGADLIQLRAKNWTRDRIREVARVLLGVLERAGVGLVVNDYPDVAHETGAPFCHLGQEDFFDAGLRHVRGAAPPGSPVRIGLSTHAPAQAERAVAAGAAYVAVGPVYPTPTKPGRPAVTLEYVRWAAAHLSIPWFAIGGINLETLDSVMAAGARRVCVVSGIWAAPDPAEACQKLKERLLSVPLQPK